MSVLRGAFGGGGRGSRDTSVRSVRISKRMDAMSKLQGEYVKFIEFLLNDEEMQKWFISLSTLSSTDKLIELRNLVFKMDHSNQDEAITKVVASLSENDVYDTVRAVLLAELNQRNG